MKISFTDWDGKSGLGIPYPKGEGSNPGNVGHIDLKRYPERISELPEIVGWPELKECLLAVNQADSLFRTQGCFVGSTNINHSGRTIATGSYINIAFEILDWNRALESYKALYSRLHQFAATQSTSDASLVEFAPIATSYNDHRITGAWSVDIWNRGLGNSEEEAKENWSAGLMVVQSFLSSESALYANELKKGLKTIS